MHGRAFVGNITAEILDRTRGLRLDDLSEEAVDLIRQCWLDWFAVSLAGAREQAPAIILAEAVDRGCEGDVRLVGRSERLSLNDAIMFAGTASHALDYDDGNTAMMAHPSVTLAPALFCLGQQKRITGRQLMESFVAGYEAGSRIGRLVSPDHYARGFHGTATMGAFASAAACAHLLGLDRQTTQIALGIAGTQASGLQAVFGTMSKPLHAGRCSLNGAQAARLAKLGFTAPLDILGSKRGFAETHSSDFDVDAALAEPEEELHLFAGRFKFHAACQATHAAIEATRLVRTEHDPRPDLIEAITIHSPAIVDQVCNIPKPATALELKFSIVGTVAMTLLGRDTSDPDAFTLAMAEDPGLQSLCAHTAVTLDPSQPRQVSNVEIRLRDGTVLNGHYDDRKHQMPVAVQGERLRSKFQALASRSLGEKRMLELEQTLLSLEELDDVSRLAELTATPH